MPLPATIQLLRPNQWIKNIFVVIPTIFAGTFINTDILIKVLLTLVLFSIISSAVYCFNDIHDLEIDKQHPYKSSRPLASGAVSKTKATIISIFLSVLSLGTSIVFFEIRMTVVFMSYLFLNLFYTWKLKQFAIIDIVVISLGFLLRLEAGSIAGECVLSKWIVIIAFLLTLMLALGKRREDACPKNNSSNSHSKYTTSFIDSALTICAASVITSYFIYAIVPSSTRFITSDYLYTSGFPVVIGILRYLQICLQDNNGGNHSILIFKDSILKICILCYILSIIFCLYDTFL